MPIPGVPSSSGTGYGTPISSVPGPFITLAEIERETTKRVGPHYLGRDGLGEEQSTTNAATTSRAYFDALKTSANIEDVANLYMLRRGNKADGSTVSVAVEDRLRLVLSHDPADGSVLPDRNWGVAPIPSELVEFHFLEPERELRPSVRAGLRRCYFEDRATVTLSGAAAERDVTASLAWLTLPGQVRRIQFSMTGATTIPADQDWFQPFARSGHVWLAGWPDEYPNTLLVTALRPHFTWVNGADSTNGPTLDGDTLSVTLNYAVAAAHIEAWRIAKARLQQAAAAGYQISQQDAADEFTRQATGNVQRAPRQWAMSAPFSVNPLSSVAR